MLAARAAFETVPQAQIEAAKVLGARPLQTFFMVVLPEAWPGVAAGRLLAWVRIIDEFGIATIFAYFPQGIPVKLYVNLQNEGVQSVYALLWVMLAVSGAATPAGTGASAQEAT